MCFHHCPWGNVPKIRLFCKILTFGFVHQSYYFFIFHNILLNELIVCLFVFTLLSFSLFEYKLILFSIFPIKLDFCFFPTYTYLVFLSWVEQTCSSLKVLTLVFIRRLFPLGKEGLFLSGLLNWEELYIQELLVTTCLQSHGESLLEHEGNPTQTVIDDFFWAPGSSHAWNSPWTP